MFSPSLFKLLHLQSKNTYKNRKTNRTTGRKTKKQPETTEISQPEPERYLFAVGSRAGYPVFLFFLMFFLEFLCFFLYVSFCFLFVFA